MTSLTRREAESNLLLMSNDAIFKVTNHHVESCGVPPRIGDERGDE